MSDSVTKYYENQEDINNNIEYTITTTEDYVGKGLQQEDFSFDLKGMKYSDNKAPIFTFCEQFKEAIFELALRSKQGHEKYGEADKDWRNFERVENPDFEYSNAMFRHALGIGDDTELEHYIATAWNAIARLQTYIKK